MQSFVSLRGQYQSQDTNSLDCERCNRFLCRLASFLSLKGGLEFGVRFRKISGLGSTARAGVSVGEMLVTQLKEPAQEESEPTSTKDVGAPPFNSMAS